MEPPHTTSIEVKLNTIKCYLEVKSVSEDIGYIRATIYQWRKNIFRKEELY
jgi:transposase-like protein